MLIWRQPEEDFNTNSTLIVMPGEVAIFVNEGTVEQVFENGTYKLDTNNYPFISRLRNAFTGGISTFNCVVYFVRTTTSHEVLWGTSSPIQARDKVSGIRVDIRCRGSFRVKVENGVKFLEKLLGNNLRYGTAEELDDYFYNEFQSKIRSTISKNINEMQEELIGIDARMDEISQQAMPQQQGKAPQQAMQQPTQENGVAQSQASDPMETLMKLKQLLDAGLIEQSEYDAKKTEILSKM